MKSKIIKRPQEESGLTSESIPSLKKEIAGLEKEIINLKTKIQKANNKILTHETTIIMLRNKKAKSDERFLKLQAENEKLKKEISLPSNIHQAIAAIKGIEHDKPPTK